MSKYNYGGMSFKTKATLTNYIKYILRNTKLYTPLSGKDLSVVDDVLRNHSEYEQKVGVGDYEILIRPCPINSRNRQFYIVREDGSSTDFSYMKAITPVSKTSDVKKALRDTINSQAWDISKSISKRTQTHEVIVFVQKQV